jgi:hypothetical protein
VDGLVDLGKYPHLQRYLLQHERRLRERHVAQRRPSQWWRTIDRIDPTLARRPKLLIPDLKDRVHPVLDQGTYYPLHSLYYLVSETWDLRALGGLLLSNVANAFVESYSVRMANGYLRASAQYLRRIRLPDPATIKPRLRERLVRAFEQRDIQLANRAACEAYGITEAPAWLA